MVVPPLPPLAKRARLLHTRAWRWQADLDLRVSLLVNEANRATLYRSPHGLAMPTRALSAQWLLLCERLFFLLDAPG